MTCTNCATDLSNGYQSSRNLNLCEGCADLAEQGHICAGEHCVCIGGDEDRDAVEADPCYDEGEIEPLHPDYDPDAEDDRTTFDMSDDADALASAGWGTDEQYGYYGSDEDF